MSIYFAVRQNNKTFSTRCTKALASRLGGTVIQRSDTCPAGAELLVHWGYKPSQSLVTAIDQNIPFIILDRGYFDPERVNRVSISFNGHHGLSMPVDTRKLSNRRYPILLPLREDDYHGENTLIVGQLPNDASLRRNCIEAWMGRAAAQAIEEHGLPAVKRPHPKSLNAWEPQPEPLDRAFEKAKHVYTFSSTTAVQSLIQGIPTSVAHPCSPAWMKGRYRNRAEWARDLAFREYDLLDDGDSDACVKYIEAGLGRATDEASRGIYDTEGLR